MTVWSWSRRTSGPTARSTTLSAPAQPTTGRSSWPPCSSGATTPCIRFIEVDVDVRPVLPHINIKKTSYHCTSAIGKITSNGGQDLSISPFCTHLGGVAHELGHALGLLHQENRKNRNKFVRILYDNIRDGTTSFFDKISTNSYSVPYDLTSVMHSRSKSLSKNGLDTIRAKNFLHQDLLEQDLTGPSHRDKQIVSAMYNCTAGCPKPPTCRKGGFVGKNCECVCPPNTSGKRCETSKGSYYGDIDCGDKKMTTQGTITSPNYPNKFPTNVTCWWVIKSPKSKHVKISITDMAMQHRQNDDCSRGHLALRYTGDVYINDQKACGSELQGKDFTSTGRQFIVQFKSGDLDSFKGFSANVEFVA